jgi:hypothetical protein
LAKAFTVEEDGDTQPRRIFLHALAELPLSLDPPP